MKRNSYICIGGFFGAIARYLFELINMQGYYEPTLMNTLLINILGSFILAFIMIFSCEVKKISLDIRLGITTGFLGSFTTFSTLCKYAVDLLKAGDYLSAFSYMILSTLLGFGMAYLGFRLAGYVGIKVTARREKIKGILDVEREGD